eukprot:scaffold54666_cov68-Phaeocystis_antarctica.AAC.8
MLASIVRRVDQGLLSDGWDPATTPLPCGLPVAAWSPTASTTRPSRPSKTPSAVTSKSKFSERPPARHAPPPAARRARLACDARLTPARCPPPPSMADVYVLLCERVH